MAETLTYDLLVSDIQTYAERSDSTFVAQVPRIIMLAENRIAADCRGLGFLRYAVSQMTAGNPVVRKPVRWRQTASFRFTTGVHILQRSYEWCRTFAPDPSVLAAPRYYADYGYENWYLAQTPDQGYNFEVAYFERPLPLDSENQTNWTTRYAPQLLLYAALLEAQPFLKNTQQLQTWQQMYEQAKHQLAQESQLRVADQASMTRSPE